METLVTDLEQNITEQDPQEILLKTATDILEYRMDTASSTGYKNTLEKMLKKVEVCYTLDSPYVRSELAGILGESIFLNACQNTGIPITVSNGEEDSKGIDFFLFGIPIDVSTTKDPKILSEKVGKDQAQLLCLPHFIRQRHIVHTADTPRQLDMFLTGDFLYAEYFTSLVSINKELHYMMQSCLIDHTENEYKIDFSTINSKKTYRLGNLIFLISRRLKQF